MPADTKVPHIALLTVALLAALALVANVSFAAAQSSAFNDRVACAPLPPNIIFLGPARTVEKVEIASLKIMSGAPGSPQVAFGYGNSEWRKLKEIMRPGDTIHEYKTDSSGGHLVLRRSCFIGKIVSWMR